MVTHGDAHSRSGEKLNTVKIRQTKNRDAQQSHECLFYLFLFIHYSRATYGDMARLFAVQFLSAVRAVAARC